MTKEQEPTDACFGWLFGCDFARENRKLDEVKRPL